MLRLPFVAVAFVTMTAALAGSLWTLRVLRLPGRRALSLAYSRTLCALLGVRIRVVGEPARDRPALIVANHASWLDIVVLTAIAPVVFVAKREIANWPLVGLVARARPTVFVDRNRRHQTADVNAQIAQRLAEGDSIVLFAEGTSSDGNRVLPFRSALVGSAQRVALQPTFTGEDRKAVARSLESTVRRLTSSALRSAHDDQAVGHSFFSRKTLKKRDRASAEQRDV
jgi:1-acyl-sn-glycerol-3-phosphate acyltransferase